MSSVEDLIERAKAEAGAHHKEYQAALERKRRLEILKHIETGFASSVKLIPVTRGDDSLLPPQLTVEIRVGAGTHKVTIKGEEFLRKVLDVVVQELLDSDAVNEAWSHRS